MEQPTGVAPEVKKDGVAKLALVMGIASAFFSFIGIIPLLAIILGIVGVSRTQQAGTGRWMAVVGLILGIIFTISSLSMNGHISLDNASDTKAVATPSYEYKEWPSSELKAEIESVELTNQAEIKVTTVITNVSGKTIRAFRAKLCFNDIFKDEIGCWRIEQVDPLEPGASENQVLSFYSAFSPEEFPKFKQAKTPENLSVTLYESELVRD